MGVYYFCRRSNRPVQTHVVATAPSPGTTTVVNSSQAGTSTAAPVQYPLQPVYKDAQFSNQDAPPSYADATAYPQAAQVTSKRPSLELATLWLKLVCNSIVVVKGLIS